MAEDTKPVAGDDEQGIVEEDSTSRMSLTRGKALGVGAVALGGAALSGLASASRAQAATAGAGGTTSLTSAAAQGSKVLAVKSTTGFAIGNTVWIDLNDSIESATVVGVNATGLKLTLGANLGIAHNTGVRVSLIPPVVTNPVTFRSVLTQLASDPTYRAQAIANPSKITTDHPGISLIELSALRGAAILSGIDLHAINSVRNTVISGSGTGDPGAITIGGGGVGIWGGGGWTISCTCCCCCCCGETAVVITR